MKAINSLALVLALALSPPALAQNSFSQMPADGDVTAPGAEPGPATAPQPPPLPTSVTPPPLPTLADYFLGVNGRQVGPLNEAELRRHIADGTLTAATLVWTEGMAAWTAARDVPDIAALLSGTSQPATDVATTKDKSDAAESVEDAAAWLAGSWHYSGSVPIPNIGQGETDLTQILSPNGTFTGSGTIRAIVPQINSSNPIDMQLTNTGTWKAERTPKGQLSLSTDSTTTVSAPAVGIPAQTERHSDVTVLEIVDRNTLRDDEGMIWRRRD